MSKTDKRYKAIFFDWDGTAVKNRKEPADKVAELMKPLLGSGVKLIIISGTTYDKIADGRLHGYFTEKELDNLYLGLARGAHNYSFEDGQPVLHGEFLPKTEEKLRVHDCVFRLHQHLLREYGLEQRMEELNRRLVRVAKDLRTVHRFNGYIHLKSIPGASRELVHEAGLYADRLSVNIEIPKEENLKLLAPEKDHRSVYAPMSYIRQGVLQNSEDRKKFRHAPRFVPAGQSTQMIVGATAETDKDILFLSSALYSQPTMRRVYYSGYVPVNAYDPRLPALKQPPLVRENRLYQADWLMRFYQFKVDEIVDDAYPDLDLEVDPKLAWALRHPEQFPVDVNKADYEMLLRVPGIGVKSARLIVASRRFSRLGFYQLKKMGAVMKKAQYFITCNELPMLTVNELTPQGVRRLLVKKKPKTDDGAQLQIRFDE